MLIMDDESIIIIAETHRLCQIYTEYVSSIYDINIIYKMR